MLSDHVQHSLNVNGFCLIRGGVGRTVVDAIAATCKENCVDYCALKPIVLGSMIDSVNTATGWDAVCPKWRLSNSTNKTDAGNFHRDHKFYDRVYPIYTALTYIDGGHIGLVPGSHAKTHRSLLESVRCYSERIELFAQPCDLLIIHSNLLHRGLFFKTHGTNDRRLLQMFEISPSYHQHCVHSQLIYNIPVQEQNKHTHRIVKINAFLYRFALFRCIINMVAYILASMRSVFAHPQQMIWNMPPGKTILTTQPTMDADSEPNATCRQKDNLYYKPSR